MVVLGGAGDLAVRHLLPGLLQLRRGGLLPEAFAVVAIGREELTRDGYRRLVERSLRAHVPESTDFERAGLLDALDYVALEITEDADLGPVIGSRAVLLYCSLPPWVYPAALTAVARAGLPDGSRLALEKPVGEDLASARLVHRLLREVADESAVFRVDHFLHHEVVQDLAALRLANPVLRAVWSREHIESVHVVWEEKDGVRGRAAYFDRAGTFKDMLQSHLLQVLALLAMEPPASFDPASLPQERRRVLERVRGPGAGEAGRAMRARYVAGQVDGRPVEAYADSPGVLPERGTETYAAVALEVDNDRWRGVPFVLRSGQAIGSPRRQVVVRFRGVPGAPGGVPTTLRLEMAPARMTLELPVVGPSGFPELVAAGLGARRGHQSLPASARLLREVLAGRQGMFVSEGEVEECWRITEAARASAALVPMTTYPAGSGGPAVPPGVLRDVGDG